MSLEQKLHLKLSQRLVMTPTLQQAIKLLQLSRLDLEQAIAEECQTNPLIELQEESGEEESGAGGPLDAAEAGGAPAVDEGTATENPPESASESAPENADQPGEAFSEVELDSLFSNYLHDTPSVASSWEEDEEGGLGNMAAPELGLFESLSAQLRLVGVEPGLLPLCEFIVGNLEPDGYLRAPVEELAAQLGADRESLEGAIAVVQRLEPPGIGARSLAECFLLQLGRMPETGEGAFALARDIVSESLDDLLHQRWDRLLARHGVDREALKEALEVVRRLDPRPGGALGASDNPAVEPDLVVTKRDGAWRVTLNDDGLPRLRISARYLRLLQSGGADGEARGYLRERMRSALWFLRSVEQRHNTILRVGQAIVRRQENFLDLGVTGLHPLVLRDIADDIGMHESTVSRVVSNKYISTPRGVFPLKFFFHSAISHAIEGDISSVVVKEKIRDLISGEDPAHPLSDARVARQLNRMGIRIARRTVAKYREELALPSSEQRRKALR
jgi:RNA polymerase sigma-54 factor